MSTKDNSLSQSWKCPNELLKLQRLKQKKKQLAARLTNNNNHNNATRTIELSETEKKRLLEAKIAKKRTNPFARPTAENCKKYRPQEEDTVLDLLEAATTTVTADNESDAPKAITSNVGFKPFNSKDFAKFLQQQTAGEEDEALDQQQQTKHLPMDWSLKTRARFFCRTELPATTLKTSQMASGLTSFVRCIDPQNSDSGLDISPATCFNAGTFYWQHPHIPWATLYPRNSKNNTNLNLGEVERQALLEDWDQSFRGLFHLLRARQCAYFYVCANTFTVLFRAAGTAGCDEMHALITPTTRGIRSLLRQEGIEFTMPLKRENNLNKSDNANATAGFEGMAAEEDEAEEDEWLESLGVDEKEIKRIQSTATRQAKTQEMLDDFSDHSLLLIEGVECQGFFSFLLNAKSSISSTGRLAGVPPTLLAPVAFPKATMQQLATRSNLVRMDGVDYCSIEVKGVVLPSFLPYVCHLLGESKDTFSVTLASSLNTLAFSKATQCIVENAACTEQAKEATSVKEGRGVFGQENLSDCGLLAYVVKSLCRTGVQAVTILERVCYDKEHGYAWS